MVILDTVETILMEEKLCAFKTCVTNIAAKFCLENECFVVVVFGRKRGLPLKVTVVPLEPSPGVEIWLRNNLRAVHASIFARVLLDRLGGRTIEIAEKVVNRGEIIRLRPDTTQVHAHCAPVVLGSGAIKKKGFQSPVNKEK